MCSDSCIKTNAIADSFFLTSSFSISSVVGNTAETDFFLKKLLRSRIDCGDHQKKRQINEARRVNEINLLNEGNEINQTSFTEDVMPSTKIFPLKKKLRHLKMYPNIHVPTQPARTRPVMSARGGG